jgi:hypothetical protein
MWVQISTGMKNEACTSVHGVSSNVFAVDWPIGGQMNDGVDS